NPLPARREERYIGNRKVEKTAKHAWETTGVFIKLTGIHVGSTCPTKQDLGTMRLDVKVWKVCSTPPRLWATTLLA
ncbi:Hypothetical predicted protein, partial [Paramuricea clavata]